VRYVGEPVALVVAESRYIAEDAARAGADRVMRRSTAGDRSAGSEKKPGRACSYMAEGQDPNEISVRRLSLWPTPRPRSKRPTTSWKMTVRLPPALVHAGWNVYVCVAQHNPADGSYDCMANFQGPFQHPIR